MKKKDNKTRIIVIAIIAVAVLFLGKGIFKKKEVAEIPPKPVTTARAFQQDAPIFIESFGNFYSPNDVDIKSQVTGEIKEVCFKEGQEVKKGDLLFIIDPAPYKATLDKVKAALMQDEAVFKLSQITLERNKGLFEKELISKQDFDQYSTDLSSAKAKVDFDNAQVEFAKISLEYCYVRSPVDGLTGKRKVDLGNIVNANAGQVLVNVKTVDILYVDFTIHEGNLNDVRNSLKENKLRAEVYFDDNVDKVYEGKIELLDNAVDNMTGTVLLRASVSNKDRSLWAGQFVRVRLLLGEYKNAVLVPYEAVQLGQKGSYLFAITGENKADLRIVKTASRQKDYIVILNGVAPGEKIVTSGQLGLSPGANVLDITNEKEEK